MPPPRPTSPARFGPQIQRLIAPNASPMTYWGTNTYLVGTSDVAVIDPGPEAADHLEAIVQAVPPGGRISHILVTHAHLDHSPGARALSRSTGAPVLAFGRAEDGRSAVMRELSRTGFVGGGEGVDAEFAPDIRLAHGAQIKGSDWTLTALHTPGHMGNHLSFALGDVLFCGDLIMAWSSSLVSPPDGDLSDFMISCRALQAQDWRVFHSGHGPPIEDPAGRLDWVISHRMEREAQILAALGAGLQTVQDITAQIYAEIPPQMHPAAARNVFAHLIDLVGKSSVAPSGPLHFQGRFLPK